MAIDTTNEKLALLEWDNVWEPAIPLSPGSFGQDDKQQLLWGYPGILFVAVALLGPFPDNRVFIKVRDKRTIIEFREKRAVIKFRDKRAVIVGDADE